MVIEDRPEFQEGQRVRVREEGGDLFSKPDIRWLGSEGTIQKGTGAPLVGPPTFYLVEFDRKEVMAISADWLELK